MRSIPFNALGTGITVKATIQANNWQATQTALAGGAGPDIVGTPGPSFAMQLALAGSSCHLTTYAEQFGWDRPVRRRITRSRHGERQALQHPDRDRDARSLLQQDALRAERAGNRRRHCDELMALAEQIDAAGIIPFAHANAEWRPANEWFVGEFLNHSAGGPQKVYDALTGSVPWTDPDFVDAIEVLNQMQQNGWFSGGLDRYYTVTDGRGRVDVRRRRSGNEDRGHLVPGKCRRILRRRRRATRTNGVGFPCRR